MRILMAFHAPPYPPDIGPSRRHYHVLAETLKRHDVTVQTDARAVFPAVHALTGRRQT